MRVVVVGTGYVGLVSGVCLAAKGHRVTCVDIDQEVVDRLSRGVPHIYERGLEDLLKSVLEANRFGATTDLHAALDTSELAVVAVGTPSEAGEIDLRQVRVVAKDVGDYMRVSGRALTVVVKSTVVPGTTDTVVRQEIERASGIPFPEFGLGMNPEFLREGDAVEDFMKPDRIVLGHDDNLSLTLLEDLYSPWTCEKLRVNTRTAELIKYANNALLATQISAMNEIANLSAELGGIDVMDVVRGVTLDKRWNPIVGDQRLSPGILSYLVPGCGFGGSCFPKDVQAIRSKGMELGLDMALLGAVLSVNDNQPRQVIRALERRFGSLGGRRIVVLGLAFKPGTDDVRESPSIKIVASLIEGGADIVAHDPVAIDNFNLVMGATAGRIHFAEDWQSQVADAEAVIVVTRWPEYAKLTSIDTVGKVVFDTRRMFERSDFPATEYIAIGYNHLDS